VLAKPLLPGFKGSGQRTGGERTRTADPRLAKPVLSQLSYAPTDISLAKLSEGKRVNVFKLALCTSIKQEQAG